MADSRHVLVPRSVEYAQLLAVCEVLGVDPVGVRSLEIGRGYVDVTIRMTTGGEDE